MVIRRTRDGRRANTPMKPGSDRTRGIDEEIGSNDYIDPGFDQFEVEDLIGRRVPTHDEIY